MCQRRKCCPYDYDYCPRDALDTAWPDARALLEDAVKTQRHSYHITDVYEGVISGMYELWLVLEEDKPVAAFTTRIVRMPNCKTLSMDWVGGDKMANGCLCYRKP